MALLCPLWPPGRPPQRGLQTANRVLLGPLSAQGGLAQLQEPLEAIATTAVLAALGRAGAP